MHLTLDVDLIRGLMTRRRAATEMQLPMSERTKVYFMTHRAQLLSNFSLTAGAWMMLLIASQADGAEHEELQRLKAEIVQFKEWAEDALNDLRLMGLRECIEDGDTEMPDDPELAAALRRMFDATPGARKPLPPRAAGD